MGSFLNNFHLHILTSVPLEKEQWCDEKGSLWERPLLCVRQIYLGGLRLSRPVTGWLTIPNIKICTLNYFRPCYSFIRLKDTELHYCLFKTRGLCCRQKWRKEVCVTFLLQSSPSCTSGWTLKSNSHSAVCVRGPGFLHHLNSAYKRCVPQKLEDWCCQCLWQWYRYCLFPFSNKRSF